MTRTVCLYHRNCNDGLCAAAIVAKFYYEMVDEDFIDVDYTDPEPPWDAIKGNHVIMVDFCWNDLQLMQEIAAKSMTLTVLDHHKTAVEALGPWQPPNGTVFFDMECSGASLAWWYYFDDSLEMDKTSESIPTLIKYVEDRDLWRNQLEGTEEIYYYLSSFPMTIEAWREHLEISLRRGKNLHLDWIEAGGRIMRWVDNQQSIWLSQWKKNKTFLAIDGMEIPIINTPKIFASKLAHLLAIQEDAAAAVCYYWQDGKVVYSIRRNDQYDIDVGALAKSQGGGGHAGAAGWKTDYWPQFNNGSG